MNSLEAPPEGANLGLLYATDALAGDLSSVLAFLRERTRIEHWVGNIGFGVAASGVEYHDRPALSVLTAALPEAAFGSWRRLPTMPAPARSTSSPDNKPTG